ncbi:recombinase family protein [Paeniglutamicibacter sp.]|uniref:recombinase family protein n=1 Tax=Paeniglutamicibacter sp. TaxID=1934391 RepID=UPI00398983D9
MTTSQPTKRPGATPRAVLYLRQSVAREESISLELQETAGRAHAKQHGYNIVAVEADPGISGRTWKRPAVQRVMTMIEDGKADIIVLWKWSRLSRSRLDWAVAADKVETAGGRIESATEPLDVSTSTGRLARGMLTEFAAFESERIGDSWKEAHARRIRQGKPATGKPRFGYTYSKEEGFAPDPITGPILAELYRRYINGVGFKTLTMWLNEQGIVTAAGYTNGPGPWSVTTLCRVLDSGFGAGYITFQKKLLPGIHQAVITDAEWTEYQTRRDARRINRSGENTQYLLTGMIYCKHCNKKMYGSRGNNSSSQYNYRCLTTNQVLPHDGGSISGPRAEAAVLDWIHGLAADINRAAEQAPVPAAPKSNPLPALRRSLLKVSSRLDTLTAKFLDGTIPQDTYERMRDALLGEREATERRIREGELDEVKPAASLVPGLLENWDLLPLHTKRDLLTRVVGRVEVEYSRPRNTATVLGRWEV